MSAALARLASVAKPCRRVAAPRCPAAAEMMVRKEHTRPNYPGSEHIVLQERRDDEKKKL